MLGRGFGQFELRLIFIPFCTRIHYIPANVYPVDTIAKRIVKGPLPC